MLYLQNDWIRHLEIHRDLLKEFPAVPKLEPFDHKIPQIDVFECKAYEITDENFKSLIESTWTAGEDGAIARLNEFATGQIQKYKELRDFPAIDGTSRLSPYLALGLVSAKHCLNVALDANNGKFKGGNENIAHWISEICWREFFRSILCNFPRVSKSQPFNLDSKRLKWRFDEVEFRAWKEGKTGYPIVDAGMRELKATGYISNRLRMIAASFLTKDLLMNWQLGEAHFMSHLIDGDLASNNGGWQWAASTGVDTRSYLRHFNPKLQSEKFDSDGSYIRRWVPELRHLDAKRIHDPYSFLSPGEFAKLKYDFVNF